MPTIPEDERKRILAIAREVRRHVRKGAGAYCTPDGLCGEASLALSLRLTRAGVPHEIWGGMWSGPNARRIDREHAWIVFPQYDHAILDVTADQYHKVPPIWFPANEEWYDRELKFDPFEIMEEAKAQGIDPHWRAVKPFIPLAGPLYRHPLGAAKVAVRRHLKHPSRSCLCHRSKTVDRVRRSMIRRLK